MIEVIINGIRAVVENETIEGQIKKLLYGVSLDKNVLKSRLKREWSKEEEDRAKDLATKGYHNKEIADILGRTHHATRNRLATIGAREGITQDRVYFTSDEDKFLLEKYKDGVSTNEIAEMLNRTSSSVQSRYWKLTRTPRNTNMPISLKERNDIIALYKTGFSRKEIALEYGRTYSSIDNILKNITEERLQHQVKVERIARKIDRNKCRRFTEEEKEQIFKLRENGMLPREIGRKFYRTNASISTLLDNMKRKKRGLQNNKIISII